LERKNLERRLAAILVADVVGYSQLMGADQISAMNALRQLRSELFDPFVASNRGKIMKRMGDGWIVEFSSISDAVACAIAIQNGLTDHDIIKLRIGIHTGEVIFEVDDLFGDGVNVAARLEALAEPGQVLISDTARNSLDGKTLQQFQGGENHQLKNIKRPIGVWRWPAIDDPVALNAEPNPIIPDKPSIAVLPFDNMSGDPEQEYFADGISEDIITALSRLRWLFVVARNSTFVHKGKAVDIQQLAKDMNVRYVLEGSVRRAGNRVRITTQLIDANTAGHLWANRYDRELEDIFALQDEITETIVGSIDTELREAEQDRARRQPTDNLRAWDFYQKGNWHYNRITKKDNEAARRFYKKSIKLDPEFALPYAGLTIVGVSDVLSGYVEDPDQVLQEAKHNAEKAVELDDREALTSFALGRVNGFLGNADAAIANIENAIKLNPSFASAYYALGFILKAAGRASEALPYFGTAIKLSPKDPLLWIFYVNHASSYLQLKDYLAMEHWARKAIHEREREYWPYLFLAMALVWQEQLEGAQSAMAKALALKPDFSIRVLPKMLQGYQKDYIDHVVVGLRKAGAPE
jgi:adenylate cyclase